MRPKCAHCFSRFSVSDNVSTTGPTGYAGLCKLCRKWIYVGTGDNLENNQRKSFYNWIIKYERRQWQIMTALQMKEQKERNSHNPSICCKYHAFDLVFNK